MPDDKFEQLKAHITRRMKARMRHYSLDEAYGVPGMVSWRGLLEGTKEYHGSEIVRSMIGMN